MRRFGCLAPGLTGDLEERGSVDKVRIYDLAKELSTSPKDLLEMLSEIGVRNKVASSAIPVTAAQSLRQMVASRNAPEVEAAPVVAVAEPKPAQPAPQFDRNFRASEFRTRQQVDELPQGEEPEPEPVRAPEPEPVNEVAPAPAPQAQTAAPSAPAAPPAQTNNGASAPNRPQQGGGQPNRNGAPQQGNNRPGGGYQGSNPRPGGGYQGNNPRPGYQGGGQGGPRPQGQGGPRPQGQGAPAPGAPQAGAPGAAPQAGVAPQGGVRPAGQGPQQRAAAALSSSEFVAGPRDRRNAKRGRYRGHQAGGARFGDRDFKVEVEETGPTSEDDKKVVISGPVTVSDLADRLRRPSSELIKKLFMMNIMRAANQFIEADVASQLAGQYGFAVEVEMSRSEAANLVEEDQGELVKVPPVVVIMGHVDHGKTSLLDSIRKANVQRGEAGGITQRIGAYETEHNGETIVFLDTPGHEAFTRMRARGAHITDIAILVVAADDGIMPQTREAIDHARAAKLPIIVAINKMDKPGADPQRIKGQLAEVGLIPEDYGGDIITMPVSAKTGDGVQELLDMVLLVAEIQDLKANPNGLAAGTVIEARQDPNRGPVATVLIHRGTLHVGDSVVIGDAFGRVRAMLDYKGENVQEAGPKKPVFITGLSQVPSASDTLQAKGSAREARESAEIAAQAALESRHIGTGRTLAEMMAKIQQGNVKELNVIVKADGQGSVEAITQSVEKLQHAEVRVRIISRGVGSVTENDVNLASASEAIIIAFTVGIEGGARSLADREDVEIRSYTVIYDALNDLRAGLEGMLSPIFLEKYSGEAIVRMLFKSTKAGTIAGCYVSDGKMIQGAILKVLRNKKQIFEGKIDALRHYKDEVKEMVASQECGISTNGFNDFQEGDILQCYVKEQIKRTIDT
jgi:translation initiation factor IF-2